MSKKGEKTIVVYGGRGEFTETMRVSAGQRCARRGIRTDVVIVSDEAELFQRLGSGEVAGVIVCVSREPQYDLFGDETLEVLSGYARRPGARIAVVDNSPVREGKPYDLTQRICDSLGRDPLRSVDRGVVRYEETGRAGVGEVTRLVTGDSSERPVSRGAIERCWS